MLTAPQQLRLGLASLWAFLTALSCQYLAFKTNGIDFSVFDFALHNTYAENFMYSPMLDCNQYGMHPSHILLPLAGLHGLFQSPWFLVLTHGVVLWCSILLLWQLSKRLLNNDVLATLLSYGFLTFTLTGRILNYGFHVELFYVPFGLWLALGWIENRPKIFLTKSFPTVASEK
ncbi:MAG: DUF2079 domain-containing protein [Myxococcota bacterium]|nr:DUF2079 domain-containing protein [Myxococcota bacterium]